MRNGRGAGLALALGVVAGAVGVTAPLAAQDEAIRIPGDRIAIWNLAGRVEVVPGTGSEVVVSVTRGGADGGRLELATGELDGRGSLRVVYPGDRVVYDREPGWSGNTTVRVRRDGTFHGSGGERVTVASSGRGLEAWADLRVEVPAGRDVRVYLAVGRIGARDVEGDLYLDTGSGAVDVAGVTGLVGVDTGSGSVTVEGIRGSVDVDTGSGSIRVSDVRGDRVRLDTGSGGVSGRGLVAGSVVIDTGSGGVDLEDVESADVRVDTGSGSVDIGITVDVERLEVDTGSGSVTVRLPASVGAEIEVDTGSGGIDLDFPVQLSRMERTHVEGRIGDGRGRIRLDTGSGSVRLVRR